LSFFVAIISEMIWRHSGPTQSSVKTGKCKLLNSMYLQKTFRLFIFRTTRLIFLFKLNQMKFSCLVIFVFFVSLSLHAQQQTASVDSSKITTGKTDTSEKIEIESEFPGGAAGWAKFLRANLTYPDKAVRKKIQGTVIVQFIVEKDGSISDIEAIDGPELLRDAAVKVLKNSPNWKPAVQYGRKVKSYKKQPITFRLE
jgi:TonB family protein